MVFAQLLTRSVGSDCDYDVTLTLARINSGPDEQLVLPHTVCRTFLCVSTQGAFAVTSESWSLGGNHLNGIAFHIYSAIPFTGTVNQWIIERDKYGDAIEGEVWLRTQSVSAHLFHFLEVVRRH